MDPIIIRIDELRRAAGWSKSEMARRIGVTRGAVHHWYTKGSISSDNMAAAAHAFGVTEEYLRYGKTESAEIDPRMLAKSIVHIRAAAERLGLEWSDDELAKLSAYFYADILDGKLPSDHRISDLAKLLA